MERPPEAIHSAHAMKSILLNVRAYNPKAAEELDVTFEALREMARAARSVINEELHDWESEGYSSLYTLEEKINALPDWITESEHD